ncbi:MAG TPA: hypothetical protein VGE46_00110 [Bdellovibrio sp.]
MTKKIFKFILVPLLALTLFVFILEVGFRARAQFESLFVAKSDSTKTQIFLVGDSILGFLKDSSSIPFQLQTNLQKIAPDQFQLQEISTPALRTPTALHKTKELLKTVPANIAILMVGKSDYLHETSPSLTTLSHFRTFRLFEASYWDLRRRWLLISNPILNKLEAEAQVAWDFTEGQRHADAMPVFESVLTKGYDYERIVRALHESYIKTQQYDRAIKFFENYKMKSTHRDLIENYLLVFKALARGEHADAAPPLGELAEPPRNRDHLRTLLWLAKENNDADTFASLYRHENPSLSDHLHATSRNNLLELIEIFQKSHTTVFLLQYPMDDVSVLKQGLPANLENVHIIDTRAILKNAAPADLMNSWREDLEHVNENGARLIVNELAPMILNLKKGL